MIEDVFHAGYQIELFVYVRRVVIDIGALVFVASEDPIAVRMVPSKDEVVAVPADQEIGALAADDQLVAYEHDGFWQPMDTLRDRDELIRLWESGEAPWAPA